MATMPAMATWLAVHTQLLPHVWKWWWVAATHLEMVVGGCRSHTVLRMNSHRTCGGSTFIVGALWERSREGPQTPLRAHAAACGAQAGAHPGVHLRVPSAAVARS